MYDSECSSYNHLRYSNYQWKLVKGRFIKYKLVIIQLYGPHFPTNIYNYLIN